MAFMRHNNNGRRHNNNFNRNRSGGNGGHQNQGQSQNQGNGQRKVNRVNHVFESNGPEGRVRGTAQQIVEKYTTMARDANMSGDKVLSLNYLQHAEHYQRLWNEIMEETGAIERERELRQQQQAQQTDGASSENTEGAAPNDQQPQAAQPQQHQNRQPREPRSQPQPAARDDDENALPNFLHVPITAGASAQPAGSGGDEPSAAPARTPRPRRPAAPPAAKPEEN